MEASSESTPAPTPQDQPQTPQPPQTPGRGGRGGRGRGGRTSSSGRGIVNVGGRGSKGQTSQQQQPPVQKVSANTGIPFGHVPAYLPGSSSLVEELDQRIMIVLRDGRHLVGNLRSFDQYSNMVLDGASERRFHSSEKTDEPTVTYYTDVPLGMYIVRGDSIVLLGQVGSEDEEEAQIAGVSIVTMKKLENDAFEELVAAEEGQEENGDDEASKSLEWDFDKDLLA